MTTLNQVWKCEVCGNIIEILHSGVGALVCCGKPMVLQEDKLEEVEGNVNENWSVKLFTSGK